MASQFDEFWNRAGPGLLDAGIGFYNKNRAQKEAAQRLAAAQGPLYQQATAGAGDTLAQARGFDPQALASEQFGAQEALIAPVQEKQLADLRRSLLARGMLGAANYNPGVEGITPNGTPMNPELAAFFAAQNADRARRASGMLEAGQNQADRLVRRAGNLQTIGSGAQTTGLEAQRTQPSRATGNAEVLRGMLMKNPGILKDLWGFGSGLFKGGLDWLGGGFGGDVQSAFTSADGLNW